MDLLRLQHVHRSSQVGDMDHIDCHLHTIEASSPLIVPYLEQAGFSIAATVGHTKIDKSLVLAMVERWRPETHTFHLPVGECTITMEDVALQLGLRVNGLPVTGPSFLAWQEECHRLLGVVPPSNQMKGQQIKLKWLQQTFATPPHDATVQQVQAYCRAYILRLIGGLLMPDKSGNRVHLMYLPLLEDFHRAGRYSWGTACLENLYREMCRASAPAAACMGGCVLLLQSWVWYRMPFLAPRCNREPSFPLARRWSDGGLQYSGTPRGDITGYRSRVDHMESNQFLWLPYRDLQSVIPREAYRESRLWTSSTALICFQNVEWHQTNRVKLQFGLSQEIPGEPANMDALHDLDMRGNHAENWRIKHVEWIQCWQERRNGIISGQPIPGYVCHTAEYMMWFRQNSRPYLSIPQQLQDPRGDAQHVPDVGPSMPTQQRPRRHARRQSSPPVPMAYDDPQPPRHSFAYTPMQRDASPPLDQGRHSIASSDGEFYSNLFGTDLGTPQSAAAYMQSMYSFGVPSFPFPVDASSSMPPTNLNLNEGVQQAAQPATADEEQPHQSRPRRNRRPPRCGTGHHLGD